MSDTLVFNRRSNQGLNLQIILLSGIGLLLLYAAFTWVYWLLVPLVLLIAFVCLRAVYSYYRRHQSIIIRLECTKVRLQIEYRNGERKEVFLNQLQYACLLKRRYKPLQSIELFEGSKSLLKRKKSIGRLSRKYWQEDLERLVRYFLKKELKRRKWTFRWGLGEYLFLLSWLVGLGDTWSDAYFEELGSMMNDGAEIILEEKHKIIEQSNQKERDYFDKS